MQAVVHVENVAAVRLEDQNNKQAKHKPFRLNVINAIQRTKALLSSLSLCHFPVGLGADFVAYVYRLYTSSHVCTWFFFFFFVGIKNVTMVILPVLS